MKKHISYLALIVLFFIITSTTKLTPEAQKQTPTSITPAMSGTQAVPKKINAYLTNQIQGIATPNADPVKFQGATSIIHKKRSQEIVTGSHTPIRTHKQQQTVPGQTQTAKKTQKQQNTNPNAQQKKSIHTRTNAKLDTQDERELDFDVKNSTGKTIYVTCFAYLQTRDLAPWRWSKSPVYAIEPEKTCPINIISIQDDAVRKNVFGYLGIFNTIEQAEDVTYELLQDKNKIDLDMIHKIKDHTVVIQTEQYGFKAPILDHDLVEKKKALSPEPELDFYVTNNTGKTIFTCCFIYQKKAKSWWFPEKYGKDDMSVWYYSKTKLLKLEPGQTGSIDVATIVTGRDREYIRGFLAVFNEDQETLAQESTYELLNQTSRLYLGLLQKIKDKKIIIESEKYGIKDDIIDYVVKPTQRPDFSKHVRS